MDKNKDLFVILRELPSVRRVANLYGAPEQITFVFFICPKINNKGLRVNQAKTGLTAVYVEGLAKSTEERVARAQRFRADLLNTGISNRMTGIFGAADSIILFPIPVPCPNPPLLPFWPDIALTSNFGSVKYHLGHFAEFYQDQPWQKIPKKIQQVEMERLRAMLPPETADYIADDFVRRVFAGFALDGVLMRKGAFGANPIILGVESPAVAILQNAALSRDQWLPVVEII